MNPNDDTLTNLPASCATFAGCPIATNISSLNQRTSRIGSIIKVKKIRALLTVSPKYWYFLAPYDWESNVNNELSNPKT